MRLNFADTPEPTGFDPIPNGKYHAIITGVEEKETKNDTEKNSAGTPMLSVEFTVATGQYENRKVWTNIVLAGNSLQILKSLLYALGYDKDEVNSDDFELDFDSLVDMELDLRVGTQKASGEYEARNKVNGFAPHMTTDSDLIP